MLDLPQARRVILAERVERSAVGVDLENLV